MVHEILTQMKLNLASLRALPEEWYYASSDRFEQLSNIFGVLGCPSADLRFTSVERPNVSRLIDQFLDVNYAVRLAAQIMDLKTRAIKRIWDQKSTDFLLVLLQVLSSPEFQIARSSGNASIALHAYMFEYELCPVAGELVSTFRKLSGGRIPFLLMQLCADRLSIREIIQVSLMYGGMQPLPRELTVPSPMKISIVMAVLMTTRSLPILRSTTIYPQDRSTALSLVSTGRSVGLAFIYGLKVKTGACPMIVDQWRMFTEPSRVFTALQSESIDKNNILGAKMMRAGIAKSIGILALTSLTASQFESIYKTSG
jgi:hypothetical protein